MSSNVTPTPLTAKKGHSLQVWRNKQAKVFKDLQSVRTASVLAYTSEADKK